MYNTRQGHCYYSIQGRALSSTDDEWALSSNDDEWALSSRYVYVCTQILGIDVSGMCVCVCVFVAVDPWIVCIYCIHPAGNMFVMMP
jgi:hypothetical protein